MFNTRCQLSTRQPCCARNRRCIEIVSSIVFWRVSGRTEFLFVDLPVCLISVTLFRFCFILFWGLRGILLTTGNLNTSFWNSLEINDWKLPTPSTEHDFQYGMNLVLSDSLGHEMQGEVTRRCRILLSRDANSYLFPPYICLTWSLTASFIAFSGLISNKFTPMPIKRRYEN